jgi:hypothetical protein
MIVLRALMAASGKTKLDAYMLVNSRSPEACSEVRYTSVQRKNQGHVTATRSRDMGDASWLEKWCVPSCGFEPLHPEFSGRAVIS